jgi:hypothetical protein
LARCSANLATHSLQMKIGVSLAKLLGVPDRVLGAEESLHLPMGLPAEPAFELGKVRRGVHEHRLLVVGLEVCVFVSHGVQVRVPAGLIACFFHGCLRSPEGRRAAVMRPACDEHGRMTWYRQDLARRNQQDVVVP